jgi:hypothetical protein
MAVSRGLMAVTRAKCERAILTSLKAGAHNLLTEDSSQRSEQKQSEGKPYIHRAKRGLT